jgi:hypothetical protein
VDEGVRVRVDLHNDGDAGTGSIAVAGRLLEERDEARIDAGVAPGEAGSVFLHFAGEAPRPGVHALTLCLDYEGRRGDQRVSMSQAAYLLLAIGAAAEPAVRVSAPEARVGWSGLVPVVLESADGAPHRVRLRLAGPSGLRVDDPREAVSVPARGRVTSIVRVFRGTLPWATRQGVLAVATTTSGPLARTTVAPGVLNVVPDPAWAPRARLPFLVLAAVLLGLAALVETLHRLE